MKKICFIVGQSGRDKLYNKILKKIQEDHELDYCFLAFSAYNKPYLVKQGIPAKKIIEADIHDWKRERVNESYLSQAEKKYGIPNLGVYWISARNPDKYTHKESLQMMQRSFKFFETFMDKEKPDFIVGDAIASLPILIMDNVARVKGVRYIQAAQSKIPGTFILKESRYDTWFQLDDILKTLRKKKLTSSQRKKAEEFIYNFKHKKSIPTYEKFLRKRKMFSVRSLRLLFRQFWNFYRHKGYKSYRSRSIFTPFQYVSIRLQRHFKKQYMKKFGKDFENSVKGEKFVLFPLHYQPEASTIVYAPHWVNQPFVVEMLSKSLPVGYKLYVKEHSNGYERRSKEFYRNIKSHPNVRLINPHEKIHDLIKRSSLVAVITSTTAWEALLYEKPVLALGNAFFNSCKLVSRPGTLEDMPKLIAKLISEQKKDKEELLTFVSGMQQASYEGNPAIPEACNNESLKDENISKVVHALQTVLQLKKK